MGTTGDWEKSTGTGHRSGHGRTVVGESNGHGVCQGVEGSLYQVIGYGRTGRSFSPTTVWLRMTS